MVKLQEETEVGRSYMASHPKISIVTVCYNSDRYMEDCILSIMRQTYDNVEHIIVDGGSTDGTLAIIQKYNGRYNMRWVSEKDEGMYDAITKGFAMAMGDIYAWLNSDDMYMPWACEIVADIMTQTDIRWCTGIPSIYTERGIAHRIPRVTPVYPRSFIRRGFMDGRICGFLEQESMFWSKELWENNSAVIRQYKYAGDYHLWKHFAESERLVTLDSVISGFRVHEGQKSSDMENYYREVGKLSVWRKILSITKIVPICRFFVSLTTNKLRFKYRLLLGSSASDTLEEKVND